MWDLGCFALRVVRFGASAYVLISLSCVLVTRSSDLAMSIVVGTAKEKLLIFIKKLSQLSFRVL